MVFHLPYLRWFKQKGYETHVCARNDYDNAKDCLIPYCDKFFDIPIQRSPFKYRNIYAYFFLKKLIESNNYDIVHCHTPMGGVLTRLAAKKARRKGTKIIYTAHGFHFYRGAPLKNWLLFYPVEKYISRFTDVLITINKEDYYTAKRFKTKKVVYIPGVGIDLHRFSDVATGRREKRKELGIGYSAFCILSVGELIKRKNHRIVIKALAMINNPNMVYIICGDGEFYNNLKQLATELKVDVRFLGFRNDVPEICSAVDLFVLPSYHEGLPVALMEAMASGLPAICSNVRGNSDLIENGKGGFLVKADDANEFANGINKIYSDTNLGTIMGRRNYEAVKKYDLMIVKKQMEEIYNDTSG